MKNLIQLKPVMGEFSEVRGLPDLLALLKARTSMARIALLQRLNLADIETPHDLLSIMDVLTNEELRQFNTLLDAAFLKRILPLINELKFPSPTARFNRICALINADNLICLIPIIEQYTLQQLRKFLDALSTEYLKEMVIVTFSGLFITKLNESLTQACIKKADEPLSFAKWPDDHYHAAADWTDWTEDDHADRCTEIISRIDDVLYFVPLLEGTQQSVYIDTLFNLLRGITHHSTDLNYLLSHLSKDKQSLLMTLIIKHGISPQQIGVISKEEYVFSQWRRCTFFGQESVKNQQDLIENSSFSDKQVRDIQNMISTLQKEINSMWPFPNKDRKIEKVTGLRALLIKSTQMEAFAAIEQIEKEYPEIRKGAVSTRTAQLLDNIRKESQHSNHFTASASHN